MSCPGSGTHATPRPAVAPPADPPSNTSCDNIMFIGARGSGEDPQGDPPIYNGDGDGMGTRAFAVYQGFQQQLHEAHPELSIKPYGLRYRALGVAYNPINFGTEGYFDSIYEGVDSLTSLMQSEHVRCPSERFVLSGYSQGALVIHLALRQLANSDSSLLGSNVTSSVVLIADPAKTSYGSETIWEGDYQDAGSGVSNAEGIWTKTFSGDSSLSGPLPSQVAGRTLSDCHNHDIVCAPPSALRESYTALITTWGDVSIHTGSYGSPELDDTGRWASGFVG